MQGLAVSYQATPVVTTTSVTYPFVQDLVLGFAVGANASRELVAFDPLTATMRWTVSKCVLCQLVLLGWTQLLVDLHAHQLGLSNK